LEPLSIETINANYIIQIEVKVLILIILGLLCLGVNLYY
jgi:hypothetical protein